MRDDVFEIWAQFCVWFLEDPDEGIINFIEHRDQYFAGLSVSELYRQRMRDERRWREAGASTIEAAELALGLKTPDHVAEVASALAHVMYAPEAASDMLGAFRSAADFCVANVVAARRLAETLRIPDRSAEAVVGAVQTSSTPYDGRGYLIHAVRLAANVIAGAASIPGTYEYAIALAEVYEKYRQELARAAARIEQADDE